MSVFYMQRQDFAATNLTYSWAKEINLAMSSVRYYLPKADIIPYSNFYTNSTYDIWELILYIISPKREIPYESGFYPDV
jgi:hypothetical protein